MKRGALLNLSKISIVIFIFYQHFNTKNSNMHKHLTYLTQNTRTFSQILLLSYQLNFFESGFYQVAQAGFKLVILLPQSPEC